MDSNDLAIRRSGERGGERVEPAPRQRSWPLLVGVPLAIAGALLAVSALSDHMVAGVLGIGLYLAGAMTALTFTGYAPRPVHATRHGGARTASERATSRDWTSSVQLGPDPEQVIGRQTGARI